MSDVMPVGTAAKPTVESFLNLAPRPVGSAPMWASNYATTLWLALDPHTRALLSRSHRPGIVDVVAPSPGASPLLDVAGSDTPAYAPGAASRDASGTTGVLRSEGEFWTIAYEGRTIRLRDSRGLRYLAALLYHPGRRLHVHEIVRVVSGETDASVMRCSSLTTRSDLGDAGDVLDARARAAYRTRLTELKDEMEDAERTSDLGRKTKLRQEIETLGHELLEAARGRKAASHVERARITVTKGIKTALMKIGDRHPELGSHLYATVRRGYWCTYQPDPRRPIEWRR